VRSKRTLGHVKWTSIGQVMAKRNHQKPFDQIGKLVTPNISASSVNNPAWSRPSLKKSTQSCVPQKIPQGCLEEVGQGSWGMEKGRLRTSYLVGWMLHLHWGWVWVTRGVDKEFDEACVVSTFKQSSLCISVATVATDVFQLNWFSMRNKIGKIAKIFVKIEDPENRGVI